MDASVIIDSMHVLRAEHEARTTKESSHDEHLRDRESTFAATAD
jgi:hypothetical protein